MSADASTLMPMVIPFAMPLHGLALCLAAAAVFRALGLDAWRGYGRLGRIGAGAAAGILAGLAMLPNLLALPAQAGPVAIAAAFESAALLPAAILLFDRWMGAGALAGAAALMLGASLGAAWPAAAITLVLGGAILLLLQRPESRASRRLLPLLGLAPALLLVAPLYAALRIDPPAAAWIPIWIPIWIPGVAAILLHPPCLIALRRILGEAAAGAAAAEGEAEPVAPAAKMPAAAAAPLLARTIGDLPEGVAIFDAAGRLVACNAPYRGLNPEIADELAIGASYAALLRAQIVRLGATPDPEAAVAAALAQHRDLPWRQEFRRADGTWIRIVESRTNDGGTLRLMSDISAVKNRELKLAELAERNAVLATAVASVTSGIVICDATRPDLPVTFVNAAFTRITGYSAEEAQGRNCRFLQGRDTDKETVERIRRGLAQHRPVTATIRNYRKDGRTFWNELNISPLFDAEGRVINWVGIMQDATSRMRTEDNLREAKNQAEVANRTKTEFLASMSHELRTPLNAILGFSEVMKIEFFGPLGPQYRQYAEDVHASGTLLLQLINDVLDISKIEAGRMELYPETVAVDELLQSCVRLLRERAGAGGVSLELAVDAGLPPLLVDRRAIKQMVNNLLSNAIKFTPKDGRVTVAARAGGDGRIDISCTDTGIGIAAADIEKVLSPFGQVDNPLSRRHQGTGLGLPIVKSLVELSGGSFRLESEPGKGTTVTLGLRAAPDPAATEAGVENSCRHRPRRQRRTGGAIDSIML